MMQRKWRTGRILRVARVVVQTVFLLMCTTLLAASGWAIALKLGWVAGLQLVPLVLGMSVSALLIWVALTLLFGRIYCSTVCPLGAVQDAVARIPRFTRKQRLRKPYHFAPANNRLRYGALSVVVIAAAAGLTLLLALLDPYSAFARMVTSLLGPVVQLGTDGGVVTASLASFAVALVTLVAIAVASWRKGRLYCNTLCPVGGTLSLISRYSFFHFDIDTDLCVNCRRCEHVCKAQCISPDDHTVDGSRCVVCFDCVDVCSENAIRYTFRHKRLSIPMLQRIRTGVATASGAQISSPAADGAVQANHTSDAVKADHAADGAVKVDRRQFLATGLIVGLAPAAATILKAADRLAPPSEGKVDIHPTHPVVPPGRRSMDDFLERCTGCGLCVAQCPTHVLRPSARELGWAHLLHPVMDYERGFCRYNCTRCTEICPTTALSPLTVEEKHIFIIGHARVEVANCIGCGACAQVCPKQTISLKPRPLPPSGYRGSTSPMMAVVDTTACIGCGACQNVCPAKPYKAIVVDVIG